MTTSRKLRSAPVARMYQCCSDNAAPSPCGYLCAVDMFYHGFAMARDAPAICEGKFAV